MVRVLGVILFLFIGSICPWSKTAGHRGIVLGTHRPNIMPFRLLSSFPHEGQTCSCFLPSERIPRTAFTAEYAINNPSIPLRSSAVNLHATCSVKLS